MGSTKDGGGWKQRLKARQVEAVDDLRRVLEVPIAFIEEHHAEHPSDPPPVFTLSPYQGAWTAVISDKAYRRSVSGWGPTPGMALTALESRLASNEVPWKEWEGTKK